MRVEAHWVPLLRGQPHTDETNSEASDNEKTSPVRTYIMLGCLLAAASLEIALHESAYSIDAGVVGRYYDSACCGNLAWLDR